MTLTHAQLLRLGAISAVTGGLLRLVSSFIPWAEASPKLESFYFVIDVALLFGLLTIYLARADRMTLVGLVGFFVAVIGQAAIIGPDHAPFGIDVYAAGVQLIAGGLFLIALDMMRTRAYPVWTFGFWIAVPFVSIGLGLLDPSPYGWGYFMGGILFSLGFVSGGIVLLRDRQMTRT